MMTTTTHPRKNERTNAHDVPNPRAHVFFLETFVQTTAARVGSVNIDYDCTTTST